MPMAVLPWNVSRLRGTRQYITHVDEQAGIRKTDEIAVGCALLADGACLDDVSLCLMYMFSMVASTIFLSFHSGGSKDGFGRYSAENQRGGSSS